MEKKKWKMSEWKRSLSLVIALIMLVSSLNLPLYAMEETGADATLYGEGEQFTDDMLPDAENLIKNKLAITNLRTGIEFNRAKQTDYYMEFTFDLGSNIIPDQFMLANHNKTSGDTYHYAIFGSDSLENLYKSENCYLDIMRDDRSELERLVTTITGASEIRYFGLRIYSYVDTTTYSVYRLRELQLSSKATVDGNELSVTTQRYTDFACLSENLLNQNNVTAIAVLPQDEAGTKTEKSLTIPAAVFDGTTAKGDIEISGTYNGHNIPYYLRYDYQVLQDSFDQTDLYSGPKYDIMTDGSVEQDAVKVQITSVETVGANKNAHTTMIYQIDPFFKSTISHFVLSSGQDVAQNCWLSSYEVYAAESYDALLDSEHLIYTYDSASGTSKKAHSMLVEFKTEIKAQYVAVVFTCPATWSVESGNYDAYLSEIAFYGEKKLQENTTYYSEYIEDVEMAQFGENLLSGRLPFKVTYNGKETADLKPTGSASEMWAAVTNGTLSDKLDFPFANPTGELDIIYELDSKEPCELTAFFYGFRRSMQNKSTEYYTGEYEVYASVELDKLFDAGNMVFDYDYMAEEDPLAHSVLQTFGEPVKACYVAVRIKQAQTNEKSGLARFSELAFYGKRQELYKEYLYGENEEFTTEMLPDGESLIAGKHIKESVRSGLEFRQTKQTDYYMEFTFDLGRNIIPDQFMLANHHLLSGDTYHYAIFGSAEQSTLYNSENCYADIVRDERNEVERLVTTITGASEIRYFGIRIYSYVDSSDYSAYRLRELQLSSKSAVDGNAISVETHRYTDFACLSENLLNQNNVTAILVVPQDEAGTKTEKSLTIPAAVFDGTTAKGDIEIAGTYNGKRTIYYLRYDQQLARATQDQTELYNNTTYSVLTDGQINDTNVHVQVTSKQQVDSGLNAHTSFVYQIDPLFSSELKYFVLSGAPEMDVAKWLTHYDVYASDSYEDLLNAQNLIYRYNSNGVSKKLAHTAMVKFEREIKARYVAIVVTCPASWSSAIDNYDANLCEIAFYGTKIYEDKTTYYSQNIEDDEMRGFGTNIISGSLPKKITYNGGIREITNGSREFWQNVTNGTLNDQSYFSFSASVGALDIVYELDPEKPYDLIACFYGCRRITQDGDPKYFTGEYEVYASVELDELFLPENKILDYDYMSGEDPLAHSVLQTFGEPVRACYVALRIKQPQTDGEGGLARFSEIAFYGEEAVIIPKPINLSERKPVHAYFVDADGGMKEVSQENLTVDEVSNLCDGDETSVAVIEANKKRTDILINMCQNAEIDEIRVLFNNADVPEYKMYASTDYVDVWRENAHIYTHTEGDNVVFDNSKVMRYLRISIPNGEDTIEIRDIQIIGLDSQLLKNKQLGRSLNKDNIRMFVKNTKTGEINTLVNKDATKWFDGDYVFVKTVEGAVLGESTYNILVSLNDLRCINEIKLNYYERFGRLLPREVRVYCSETMDEILSVDAKPLHTFEGIPDDGAQTLKIVPTLARYVRIEFVKNNWDANWSSEEIDVYDGDYINREQMTIALTEVDIRGTAVEGLQTDEDNDMLLHFKDEQTGIEWEIVRFDRNDIMTSVYSSKLVTYPSTTEQLSSLKDTLYKIENNMLYGVEFYDITGKQITDISGRNVRMYFPVENDLLNYNAMLGSASSFSSVELLETKCVNSPISAEITYSTDMRFVLTVLTTADDPCWDIVGDLDVSVPEDNQELIEDWLTDSDDSNSVVNNEEETEEQSGELENGTDKETVKTTKTITTKATPVYLWILLAALIVGLVGCVFTFVWIQFIGPRRKLKGKSSICTENELNG